jgi:hypothetical protein
MVRNGSPASPSTLTSVPPELMTDNAGVGLPGSTVRVTAGSGWVCDTAESNWPSGGRYSK